MGYLLWRQRHHAHSLVRDHIAHRACVKGHQIAPAIKGQIRIHAAFLTVIHREARVRHQRRLGKHHAAVPKMLHILHAGFLAQAADHPQAMLHGIVAVPQVADGKQRCQRRAFIVIHAPADHHIMGREVGSPVGRVHPAIACRNHIQMGDHADAVLRIAPAQGGGITLMIDHIKAESLAPGHGYIQHLQTVRAKGHAGGGQISPAHRGNAGP